MSFGLCNTPATFQKCMLAILAEMLEKCAKVFMENFSVFGPSFDYCLTNLELVLRHFIEENLVLN